MGRSLIPVCSTFLTVIPLCLLSSLLAEEKKCTVHTAGFPFRKKSLFLWWGCIVVNFMLIWKCLLDYIWGILPLYPNLIVCLAVGSKSEFRKSLIWISKPPNGKAVMGNEPKGLFLSITHTTCGQGISPPAASAEQSGRQDKTAAVLLVPWCDYVQPSCSLQVFLQATAVNHSVF